jgi:hypothetical protein
MKSCTFLFLITINIIGCKDQHEETKAETSAVKAEQEKELITYDTLRFRNKIDLDSTGCSTLLLGRSVKEELKNEMAFVKTDSLVTYWGTAKYTPLTICNAPDIKLNIGDTIFISGTVYAITGNEKVRGWPTMLTRVVTK